MNILDHSSSQKIEGDSASQEDSKTLESLGMLVEKFKGLYKATIKPPETKGVERDVIDALMKGLFIPFYPALKNEGANIKLANFSEMNALISQIIEKKPLARGKAIEVLHQDGVLAPIPEIHWSVDRGIREYSKRMGVDIKKVLTEIAELSSTPQTLFELGPGNGAFRREVSKTIPNIDAFSLCDKLHYPINSFVTRALNFSKIAAKTGLPLSDNEIDHISDFIYKLLVIKEFQIYDDRFKYDKEFFAGMQENLGNFVYFLQKKAPQLKIVEKVPSNISARDHEGKVFYPYKIHRLETPSVKNAFTCIAESNLDEILSDYALEKNFCNCISAYPERTFIGNFSMIKNLANKQIDISIASRSTVYLQSENKNKYVDFMKKMARKITPGGIHIDDSVRGNDGWRYNLAELAQVQKESGIPIKIITGSGLPQEDYCKEEVPLAFVMTQALEKIHIIEKNLGQGCKMKDLSALIKDNEYLQKLNNPNDFKTGKPTTYEEVLKFRTR